jgi:4,4'-diaponeurosporenoate glycosyltransferase
LVFLALWLSGVAGAASRLPASVATVPVHQLAWWLSLAAYGLYVAQLSWVLSRIGNFTFLTALLFPVPFVVFVGVFCISAFQLVILRRVRWKGRSIDVGERRRR